MLEEAGAEYVDVARQPEPAGGTQAMIDLLNDQNLEFKPFAPPFVVDREARELGPISQTANILRYLGVKLDLAGNGEVERHRANQVQLTISDFVVEIHDTHHPVGKSLYYEDQMEQARICAGQFCKERIGKYLDYFEQLIDRNSTGSGWAIGNDITYADLSLFQVMTGLNYAFPNTMGSITGNYPGLNRLQGRVQSRPNISVYLESEHRIAFNNNGIFRHYPELDLL